MKKTILMVTCMLFALFSVAEAAVTLMPRVDSVGAIVGGEDYVYFGRYDHAALDSSFNNIYEGTLTPILWRVISQDTVSSPKKAIFLSHYSLEIAAYDNAGTDKSWPAQTIQPWLNSSDAAIELVEWQNVSNDRKGFLHPDYFTTAEKGAFSNSYLDGIDVMTLPSAAEVSTDWFADAASRTASPKAIAGALAGNLMYFTRTSSTAPVGVYSVNNSGDMVSHNIHPGAAIRPAFILNLDAVYFKSTSDDTSVNPGALSNPYLLYVAKKTLDPLTSPQPTVDGATLTLKFGDGLRHAYTATAKSETNLGLKFAVTKGSPAAAVTVTNANVNGDTVTLTLSPAIAYGDTDVVVNYLAYNAADTDGIGFLDSADSYIPTALDGFATSGIAVANSTPDPNGGGQNPGTPTSLETFLSGLNGKFLAGTLSVSVPPGTPTNALTAIGQKEGIAATAVTKTAGATFTPTTKPVLPLNTGDALAVAQSFSVSVPVGGTSGTTGNVLILRMVIEVDKLPGFEAWKTLTGDRKTALLGEWNVTLDYEYPDKWAIMVGKGGVLSWSAAVAAGIVSFTDTSVVFDYATFDSGSSTPYAAGDLMAIPDGTSDGKIVDPVWLLLDRIVPTGVTLTPSSLYLKKGESKAVTASFVPVHANDKELIWSVGNPSVASVAKAAGADTWNVSGLTEGVTVLTATVSTDRNVKATATVTVQPTASDLIESLSVSPQPPYRRGEKITVNTVLARAASSVRVAIKRPDGQTETKDAVIIDKTAQLTYTLERLGTYELTVTATDAASGQSYNKATALTVTSGGGSSSSGGCQGFATGAVMAMGLAGILLVFPIAGKRR